IEAQIGFFKSGGLNPDNLVLATDAGVQRRDLTIRRSNGGNVGIGLPNSTAKLEIFSNSIVGSAQALLSENDDDFARLSFRTKHANNPGNNFWTIAGYNNNTIQNERLNFYNHAAGNLLTISGDGNVGIGNANPQSKLDLINGGINTSASIHQANAANIENGLWVVNEN